jgi:mono/diheme cytochrome c family protein
MLTGARAAVVGLVLAGLGSSACGDRGVESEAPEQVAAGEAEVEVLDRSLASNLPPGTTFEMAQQGRQQFPVCGVCHGLDAAGTPLGPPLNDAEWIGISGELAEIEAVIRNGVAEPQEYPIPMPVLGGGAFTDEQIRALATYVYVVSRAAP